MAVLTQRSFAVEPPCDAQPSIYFGTPVTDAVANRLFWSHTVSESLSILMEEAGYDPSSLEEGLSIFSELILPFLGPRITGSQSRQWKSYMTDDHSPIEYSWSWSKSPKIRYSFEPVGAQAGTSLDRFNHLEPVKCINRIRETLPNSDWRLFDRMADSLYDQNAEHEQARVQLSSISSSSSIFLALEIGKMETMAKAYLLPIRAEKTGKPHLSMLAEAIHSIESATLKFPAFDMLKEYITKEEASSPLQVLMAAVDCVDPAVSRLKIYVRGQNTSFDAVCSNLTMQGSIKAWSQTKLEELRELWNLVFGLDADHPTSEGFDECKQETGGILYNFNFRSTDSLPSSKLYIPAKHYGRNDQAVAQGLVTFMEKKGKSKEHTQGFLRALNRLCFYRRLDEGRGLQTYISVEVKEGSLSLTSYLSAELHHKGRWTL